MIPILTKIEIKEISERISKYAEQINVNSIKIIKPNIYNNL